MYYRLFQKIIGRTMRDKPVQRKKRIRPSQSLIKPKADEDLGDSDKKYKKTASDFCEKQIYYCVS